MKNDNIDYFLVWISILNDTFQEKFYIFLSYMSLY